MSKTYDNCVYLEDIPSDMYGKIMSVKDELVSTYFECATELPMQEIKEILRQHPKDAKMRLSYEIVSLYHGKEAAAKAQARFMKPDGAPEIEVARGTKLRDIAEKIGVSVSELRRLVEQGAIEEVGGGTTKSIDVEMKNSTLKIGKHRFLKIKVRP